MRAILALSENNVLGKDNDIPWMGRYPQDMKFFREMTSNGVVIMGYNTFKSLGRESGLPKRFNVVISRPFENKNVLIFNDLDNIIMKDLEEKTNIPQEQFWLIGGKKTYEKYLSLVDEIYLTRIPEVHEGIKIDDKFFKDFEERDFPFENDLVKQYPDLFHYYKRVKH